MSSTVLITGAAGGVGRAAGARLRTQGHTVIGLDRNPSPEADHAVDGDLLERACVQRVFDDYAIDTVIHLAAYPDEADFLEHLVAPNVTGLYHVCDAARAAGVGRLILASSIQVVTGHKWDHVVSVEDGPRVANHYALTKLWAEQLGEMYARCYGQQVIAARLGWLPRSPAHHDELQASPVGTDVFLSHDDAGRFFTACVEAELTAGQFEILFATSKAVNDMRVDLEPARRVVGFVPVDTWPDGIRFNEDGYVAPA
ncbi:MAG: NAD(P)-dependent oxidoreductase [Pseudomonadota bacterium]